LRFHLNGGGDVICTQPGGRAAAPPSFEGTILCPDPELYCKLAFFEYNLDIKLKYFFSIFLFS
jgi:hypothetical protein